MSIPEQFNRESILAFIESLMAEKDIGITKLERAAKVPKDTVRDFLRGKTYLIRADKLQKILHILGYEIIIQPLVLSLHEI